MCWAGGRLPSIVLFTVYRRRQIHLRERVYLMNVLFFLILLPDPNPIFLNLLGYKYLNSFSVSSKIFVPFYKYFFKFCEIYGYIKRKSEQKNFPLLFSVLVGSGIRYLGSRIQNERKPGSE